MKFRTRFSDDPFSAVVVERDFRVPPDYGETNTDQSSYRPDIVRVSMPSATLPSSGSFDVGSELEAAAVLLRPGLDPTERAVIADSLQKSIIDEVNSRSQDKVAQDKVAQDEVAQDKA